MDKQTITVGALLGIIGLGVGYLMWGQRPVAPIAAHGMGDGSMMSQNIDQHFITGMIPHHEGAIEMARRALERSKRPEVLSLAQGIIAAQTKEIGDMRAWYADWFGSAPPTAGMGMHMEGMEGDADALAAVSDAEFDREFLSQMIVHHEMAVVMAQMLAASTARAEMRQLADAIITSQSQEIDMMRGWISAWYGAR